MIPIHSFVQTRLDSFYDSKKIPNLIFHGGSGTGKRTIVHNFLHKIYDGDKGKMKSNIMVVNCAQGKGIKFIREELKLFAKSNIQYNKGVLFKTIVLFNADFLTNDAQSALRRCIELFTNNTRFFIVLQNKNKLLKPILSRFCEIHIPEYKNEDGSLLNLHKVNLATKFPIEHNSFDEEFHKLIHSKVLKNKKKDYDQSLFIELSTILYEKGYSVLDLIKYIETHEIFDKQKTINILIHFNKIKSEYRCEKLLLLSVLDYAFIQ
tara:strand:+ start:8043 stop:8834 length:792 start_codon:yes stop_codon:yes gene_type:complete